MKKISVKRVRVSSLKPVYFEPECRINSGNNLELIRSIKQHGISTPLLVYANGTSAYIVCDGHRRLMAAKILGLETVPVIVHTGDTDLPSLFKTQYTTKSITGNEQARIFLKEPRAVRDNDRKLLALWERRVGSDVFEELVLTYNASAYGFRQGNSIASYAYGKSASVNERIATVLWVIKTQQLGTASRAKKQGATATMLRKAVKNNLILITNTAAPQL